MKFIVTRTSLMGPEKPCEEAFQAPVTYIGRSMDAKWVEKTDMVWFVEINSIDELIEFSNRHGDLVVGYKDIYGRYFIEIYDWYRE